MTFADLTLIAGRVHSRRLQDTAALLPEAIEQCRGYLGRLKTGERLVEVDFPGLDFAVRLGLPEHFPPAPGNDRFFCVGAVGSVPFQYNLVLPVGVPAEAAQYGLTTAFAVSLYDEAMMTAAELEEMVEPLRAEAPLLATALLPLPDLAPPLIIVASDFCTCFAAAWLTEP